MTDETLAAVAEAIKDNRRYDAEQILRAAMAQGHPAAQRD